MRPVVIPESLVRNAVAAWGADGRRWLVGLPAAVAAISRDWGLDVGEPFPLSFHWVAPAGTVDGAALVLKLGPPGPGRSGVEAAALRAFAGGCR